MVVFVPPNRVFFVVVVVVTPFFVDVEVVAAYAVSTGEKKLRSFRSKVFQKPSVSLPSGWMIFPAASYSQCTTFPCGSVAEIIFPQASYSYRVVPFSSVREMGPPYSVQGGGMYRPLGLVLCVAQSCRSKVSFLYLPL